VGVLEVLVLDLGKGDHLGCGVYVGVVGGDGDVVRRQQGINKLPLAVV
jgi:hypothetical protein